MIHVGIAAAIFLLTALLIDMSACFVTLLAPLRYAGVIQQIGRALVLVALGASLALGMMHGEPAAPSCPGSPTQEG